MANTNSEQVEKKNKKDFFIFLLEALGFVRIVASPFLIGVAIGFVVYISKPGNTGFIIALSIAGTGLIAGVIWAIKISKKKSTLDYISTASSPDFDKFDTDEK